jgi:LysR family glycine cleavage system transcriptional activator
MTRIPLHFLPTFVAVARLGNLRAAADALHLTHSAVSQQVGELESRIGFALFDRRGRRIFLNPAGAALLRHVAPALAQIDDGVQAAATAALGAAQALRVTMLPSFAQRWFLPRLGLWRARHPGIAIEIDASLNLVDLQRDGFHAAIRTGPGPWAGLLHERLYDAPTPLIVVGSPRTAQRLASAPLEAIAREPLLGDTDVWERWFVAAGLRTRVAPVATFNDVGLMLQAAEQDLGLAIARELLASDALRDGRLVRLSEVSVTLADVQPYSLAYPPALKDWAPLIALRDWVRAEFALSLRALRDTPAQAQRALDETDTLSAATVASRGAGSANIASTGPSSGST